MTIDPEIEHLLAPSAARHVVPGRRGRGVALSTIWRWMLIGARGRKLDSIIIGGSRYTSVEAIRRFIVGVEPTAAPSKGAQSVERRHLSSQLDARRL